jgi:protein Mpv17
VKTGVAAMSLSTLRYVLRPVAHSFTATKNKLFSPKFLLYTNTLITAGLSITGDLIQQSYQVSTKAERTDWNLKRTGKVGVTGLVIAPFVHYWYVFLDRWLPGRTFCVLCKKVLVDQVVCSPIYLSMFIVSMGFMENKSWSEFKTVVKEKGSVLYLAEWIIWSPAQFVNFYFLPTKYRVLYDNSVSMISDAMWSYVWYEMDEEEEAERTGEEMVPVELDSVKHFPAVTVSNAKMVENS